jgi:hypothetical protein
MAADSQESGQVGSVGVPELGAAGRRTSLIHQLFVGRTT